MQGWNLDRKIQVTQTRILEWYQKWGGQVYVSFSAGKDSTVLADLTAKICKILYEKLVLWFSNTGLEYPELLQHAMLVSFSSHYSTYLKFYMEHPLRTSIFRSYKCFYYHFYLTILL